MKRNLCIILFILKSNILLLGHNNDGLGDFTAVLDFVEELASNQRAAEEGQEAIAAACSLDVVALTDDGAGKAGVDAHAVEAAVGAVKVAAGHGVGDAGAQAAQQAVATVAEAAAQAILEVFRGGSAVGAPLCFDHTTGLDLVKGLADGAGATAHTAQNVADAGAFNVVAFTDDRAEHRDGQAEAVKAEVGLVKVGTSGSHGTGRAAPSVKAVAAIIEARES